MISRLQRNKLRKSAFSHQKVLFFFVSFLEVEQNFVALQFALVRCAKTPIYVRRKKKLGETNIKKTVILSISDFVQKKNLGFQQNSKVWFSKL